MADALAKLARLRRLDSELAKRNLAAATAAEREAERALVQAQATVAIEARVTLPAAPGAFAAWLPAAAQAISARKSAETKATLDSNAARLALAQRLAAQKAVETVLADRIRAERLEAARRQERIRDCKLQKK